MSDPPDWILYLAIAAVSAGSFVIMFHLSNKLSSATKG